MNKHQLSQKTTVFVVRIDVTVNVPASSGWLLVGQRAPVQIPPGAHFLLQHLDGTLSRCSASYLIEKLLLLFLFNTGTPKNFCLEHVLPYQCGTQFGSHEWKVDPIWFTSVFKKTSTQINLIFGRKVVWIRRNLMQLSDSKSVHPSATKGKWNNTMGNDCLTHDVSCPWSTE